MNLKFFLFKSRRLIIIVFHLFLVTVAYIWAFYLRFDLKIDETSWVLIKRTLPLLICIKMVMFGCFGLFYGLWRYAGVADIWRIFKVHILSMVLFVISVKFLYSFNGFPRSIFILDCILSFLLVAGIRFATRLFREKYRPHRAGKQRRAIIIGAGEAGVMVLREAKLNVKSDIEVFGFIDDDPQKKNSLIQGIRVLGNRKDIAAVVEKHRIDEIIIAIPSAKGEVVRGIIESCQIPSVKIRIVPGLQKILSGELEVKPRDILPEDLLGRETVTVNAKDISGYLARKVVLVTGAGGSIGSCLCRQILTFDPKEILLFDHNENEVYYLEIEFLKKYPRTKITSIIGDIKDIGLLKRVFTLHKPSIVFHAAAHKHVPLM